MYPRAEGEPGNKVSPGPGGSDKVETSHDIQRTQGVRCLTNMAQKHNDYSVKVFLLLSLLVTATTHGMLQYMLTHFH